MSSSIKWGNNSTFFLRLLGDLNKVLRIASDTVLVSLLPLSVGPEENYLTSLRFNFLCCKRETNSDLLGYSDKVNDIANVKPSTHF